MLVWADTNWLVASYFDCGDRSQQVLRFQRRVGNVPVHVGPIQLAEAEAVFRRIASDSDPAPLRRLLQEHAGEFVIAHPTDLDSLRRLAMDPIRRFAHRVPLSWMDAAIIGQAVDVGADHFLSFDTASAARAVAHVLKLQVFPKLSARDQAFVAALR
jgi:hypothetical protein